MVDGDTAGRTDRVVGKEVFIVEDHLGQVLRTPDGIEDRVDVATGCPPATLQPGADLLCGSAVPGVTVSAEQVKPLGDERRWVPRLSVRIFRCLHAMICAPC